MNRRSTLKAIGALPVLMFQSFSARGAMGLSKFGFIVTGTGLDPTVNRMSMKSSQFEMIAVGVETPSEGIPIAKNMVAEGVQLIELCGGFGPIWTGKIIEAIDGAIPIGSVGYGPESIDQMYRLFN